MRIAYFLNQYPMVSHSFIRREIMALEKLGCDITRIALRSDAQDLVDQGDVDELAKTRFILRQSVFAFLKALVQNFVLSPLPFIRALLLAVSVGWKSERGVLHHVLYFIEANVVAIWLKAEKIQHIHAHFGTNSATVVMLANELCSVPFSFTVHGPEEFDKPAALSLGKKIERAAFVVAISSFGKSQLSRWVDHDLWRKLSIVHCGLDEGFLVGNIMPVKDVQRLLCIGRLCEQKAQPLLLEAARELRMQGREFELVLAGDGPLRPKIESMIDEFDLRSTVRITGWISSREVKNELLDARAMVLPSFAEGLPVVIMEAMALGRVVVSTYIAGIPELVVPEENGWLVTAGNVDALVSSLEDVLDASPARLEKMGANGRDRVRLRHNIDIEATKLVSLFQASIEESQKFQEKA